MENIAQYNWSGFIWRITAALISGILLSLAFPPLKWNLLAWVGLFPLLLMPTPRGWLERLVVGYVFGYTQFALSLLWLNEVGFGAGWLLSLWCALFPMLWYALVSAWFWRLKDGKTMSFPGSGPLFVNSEGILAVSSIVAAALWVALEWVRSWLLTGFPWNFLGNSQYTRLSVIQIASYTGVFGVSFLIVLVNMVLVTEGSRQVRHFIVPVKRGIPWHFVIVFAFLGPVFWLGTRPEVMPPENAGTLRVVAVQGNMPQCRVWTVEQFQDSLDVYGSLTLKGAAEYPDADLFLWPECAVPSELDYHPYRAMRIELYKKLNKPLLLGALQYRLPAGEEDPEKANSFNSAFLLDEKGTVLDYYDKIHRVPFGEFTPFGNQFPWLREMIGMGRDLTPGRDFRVFSLPKNAKAGVNICFEDAFPEISREFVRRGANVLATITNDSWYNQSCGAEQHAGHVVFRAIENRRPFLRSGNNSHTCLVSPNGRILGLLVDRKDGSLFTRDYQAYDVPVNDDWGETFYTKYGNLFAWICTGIAILSVLYLIFARLFVKSKMLDAVSGK